MTQTTQCPRCLRVSGHPKDAERRWCGACNLPYPTPSPEVEPALATEQGAIIRGGYRYLLWRSLRQVPLFSDEAGILLYIMLNPSTADALEDDPTIRRCKGFAKNFGYSKLAVVNLFGFRATQPPELGDAADPVGPQNDDFLLAAAAVATKVVVAWGRVKPIGALDVRARAAVVANLFTGAGHDLWSLGTNQDSSPCHPLYLKDDTELTLWTKAAP